MYYALSGLLPVLCAANAALLLKGVFGCRLKDKLTLFYILTAVAAAAGVGAAFLEGEAAESLTEVILMACSMGLPYLAFERKKKLTFVWVGLMLCSLFDFFEYALVSAFPPITWQKGVYVYSALYLAGSVSALILGRAARGRTVPDFLEYIPPAIYIAIFVVDYSAYYSLTVVTGSESYAGAAVVFQYIAAVLAACCIGFIIYRFAVLSDRQKEQEHIHALELSRYEEMIRGSRDMSAFRHDYKNNLHALSVLLNSGRTDEAKEYISGMTESLDSTRGRFQTGNLLADAILSDKAAAAEKSGVGIDFDGAIPAEGINNRDLCVMLSNAVDNAIEAGTKAAPCRVRVSARQKEMGAVITVTNPVKEKVQVRGGNVVTTKADRQSHGFGIANIRAAAKKYNGYAEISCDDNVFKLEIGLVLGGGSKE